MQRDRAEESNTLKERVCYWCGSTSHRRLSRRSFLEKRVLSWLGIYPWECVMCRRRVYFRSDGHNLPSKGQI
jgi:hypothetical protein